MKQRLFILSQYLLPHHLLSRLIGCAAECRAAWFKDRLIGWFAKQYQVDMSEAQVSRIANGKRAITGDTALRLAHWFGTSPQFWMNLQALFDVRLAEQQAGTEIRSLPTKPGKPKTDHPRPV